MILSKYITLNTHIIFDISSADTKPGCVLRPSNVVPLLQQERKLLTDEDIQSCKNGFNTWAYVGDVNSRPQLSCVFQSDDAQNEFLSNPKVSDILLIHNTIANILMSLFQGGIGRRCI